MDRVIMENGTLGLLMGHRVWRPSHYGQGNHGERNFRFINGTPGLEILTLWTG